MWQGERTKQKTEKKRQAKWTERDQLDLGVMEGGMDFHVGRQSEFKSRGIDDLFYGKRINTGKPWREFAGFGKKRYIFYMEGMGSCAY